MRYDENSKKIEKFILNKKPYNNSPILLVGKNFGCGSSVLAAITIFAPSLANFNPIALPIPLLEPVINTVLFLITLSIF